MKCWFFKFSKREMHASRFTKGQESWALPLSLFVLVGAVCSPSGTKSGQLLKDGPRVLLLLSILNSDSQVADKMTH